MTRISVPIISTVIGEGGSGGRWASAWPTGSWYGKRLLFGDLSEGCAAILWKNGAKAPEAAEALKLTAQDTFSKRQLLTGSSRAAGGRTATRSAPRLI